MRSHRVPLTKPGDARKQNLPVCGRSVVIMKTMQQLLVTLEMLQKLLVRDSAIEHSNHDPFSRQ